MSSGMAIGGRRLWVLVLAALLAGCGFALAASTAAAGDLTSTPRADRPLHLNATVGGTEPGPDAQTVPFFRDAFRLGRVTYPYAMVGTNPRTSDDTTSVPTTVVPLKFVFADGHIAHLGTTVSAVTASPLFQAARFTSGKTQYGDAIRRAMFWRYVAHTDYHVLLKPLTVLPVQRIDVPEPDGEYVPAGAVLGKLGETTIHAAVPLGVVSESWFEARIAQLLQALHADPSTLPILLSRNVIEAGGVPGFHGAVPLGVVPEADQSVQTYIWASYGDPYFFAEAPQITQNTDILSHEIAEWMHDPFATNTVPEWKSPLPLSAAFYGCSNLLETGDPLDDAAFTVKGYQLQDEAFLSWFAHQEPSIGINGQYTYLGTFGSPSPPC
jgi:hypothetical protein